MGLRLRSRRALVFSIALVAVGAVSLVASVASYSTSPTACPAIANVGPDGQVSNPCADSMAMHARVGGALRLLAVVTIVAGVVLMSWRSVQAARDSGLLDGA